MGRNLLFSLLIWDVDRGNRIGEALKGFESRTCPGHRFSLLFIELANASDMIGILYILWLFKY